MPNEALKQLADDMIERLAPLGPLGAKPMFGAISIRKDGVMLGFVHDERLYLKVDQVGIERFERLGGVPFSYDSGRGTVISRSTWSVPNEILNDSLELLEWAERAISIATEAKREKKPRGKSA